jgi:hypothetical protein
VKSRDIFLSLLQYSLRDMNVGILNTEERVLRFGSSLSLNVVI